MLTVNMHEAKTQFSKLVARVEAGEEIVIARDGTPVARLIGARRPVAKRVPGRDRGLFSVPDDFDAPLPEEILAEFPSLWTMRPQWRRSTFSIGIPSIAC
jgi:prevent-host-death family protein